MGQIALAIAALSTLFRRVMAKQGPEPGYNDPKMVEIIEHILAQLSLGHSLNAICKGNADFGYPAESTFRLWVLQDTPQGIAAKYARARELQFDAWADEVLHHADTQLIGEKTKETSEGTEITTGDNVDRSRLMVDSRKWLLSKLARAKYGERTQTEITGKDGGPLVVEWASAPPRV